MSDKLKIKYPGILLEDIEGVPGFAGIRKYNRDLKNGIIEEYISFKQP